MRFDNSSVGLIVALHRFGGLSVNSRAIALSLDSVRLLPSNLRIYHYWLPQNEDLEKSSCALI